jgi:phosphate-selective porin OprO/OprP
LPVAAQAQEVSNEELLKRLEEQDQKILVLERKLEITDEAAAAAKETTPVVSAGPKGFSLRSADGKNQIRFRGTLHLDGRYLEGVDTTSIDTFVATRVRPTIEGTFGGIYDFKFMPDFAGGRSVIVDAYVAARFNPAAVVTVGKFKPPVGLERLQSSADIRFIERGLPTNLVPNRDLGVQLSGDVGGGRRHAGTISRRSCGDVAPFCTPR